MVWDFAMLAMLTYVIFITPYLIAFDISTVRACGALSTVVATGRSPPGEGPRQSLHCLTGLLLRSGACSQRFSCGFLTQSDLTQPIAIIDLTVNAIFMTDVIINFRTAFQGQASTSQTVLPCFPTLLKSRAEQRPGLPCGPFSRRVRAQTARGAWSLTASSSPSTT